MGTRITPELKACLDALIENGLKHIPFEGREYVGAYLETLHPNVQQLQHHHATFTNLLQEHLSHVRVDNFPIVLFPQMFLG